MAAAWRAPKPNSQCAHSAAVKRAPSRDTEDKPLASSVPVTGSRAYTPAVTRQAGDDVQQTITRAAGGDAKQCGRHGNGVGQFVTELTTCSPCPPVIALLGFYPREMRTNVHTKPARPYPQWLNLRSPRTGDTQMSFHGRMAQWDSAARGTPDTRSNCTGPQEVMVSEENPSQKSPAA